MVKDELKSIAAALIGGARYGVKIRLPHALVMTFLFRRDLSHSEKLKSILRLALQHASSLAAFATIYKSILALLKYAHRELILRDGGETTSTSTSYWNAVGRSLLCMIGKCVSCRESAIYYYFDHFSFSGQSTDRFRENDNC